MTEKCRCLFPASIADRSICEAVGGECIPDPFGELGSEADPAQSLIQAPQSPPCGPPMPPSPEVQYVSQVPVGYFEPSIVEDPDNRRYIWEE